MLEATCSTTEWWHVVLVILGGLILAAFVGVLLGMLPD